MKVYAEWLDQTFDCAGFGPDWNGFATPIMTREQALTYVKAHNAQQPAHARDDLDYHCEPYGEWIELVEYGAGRDAEATSSWRVDFHDGLIDMGWGFIWQLPDDDDEASAVGAVLAQVEDYDTDTARRILTDALEQLEPEPEGEPDFEAILEARAEDRKPWFADSPYWEGELS